VWDRGDWTLQLDGEVVGSGTATAPRAGSGIAMRREDDALLIECTIPPVADLRLAWH
jgi:hypothetical protein